MIHRDLDLLSYNGRKEKDLIYYITISFSCSRLHWNIANQYIQWSIQTTHLLSMYCSFKICLKIWYCWSTCVATLKLLKYPSGRCCLCIHHTLACGYCWLMLLLNVATRKDIKRCVTSSFIYVGYYNHMRSLVMCKFMLHDKECTLL